MKKSDVIGILALLETAYPAYYAKQDDRQRKEVSNLWAELFADDNPQLVYAAVKTLIVSGGAFPPSIGEIKNKMHDLTASGELSETEAWALVAKACSNGLYGYKEEYAKLPPEVQVAVGSAEQLREWAMLDEQTLQSVVGSNFMRGFKTVKKRERELAMLPSDVRLLLDSVGQTMMLREKNESEEIA